MSEGVSGVDVVTDVAAVYTPEFLASFDNGALTEMAQRGASIEQFGLMICCAIHNNSIPVIRLIIKHCPNYDNMQAICDSIEVGKPDCLHFFMAAGGYCIETMLAHAVYFKRAQMAQEFAKHFSAEQLRQFRASYAERREKITQDRTDRGIHRHPYLSFTSDHDDKFIADLLPEL